MDESLALHVLGKAMKEIISQAKAFGLDFFPMRFELVPAEIIYTVGAYGMPTRFSHWSHGKAFYRLKMQYDYNLSRIYELVVNSNPCYAFLLEGNTFIQNKMVIAHVLAHSDFFKNNRYFQVTSRKMVETMACNASRIEEYEQKYGQHEVEIFLDAALSILAHIDPRQHIGGKGPEKFTHKTTEYDDLFDLDSREKKDPRPLSRQTRRFPERPEKDLVAFIAKHSPSLEDWQRDILYMLREEMLYFWPQVETKIMNEGWATFWHLRIMRALNLTETETVEFAKMNSNLLLPSKTAINPYHLGHAIFEDIFRRWNKPSRHDREKYGRRSGQGLEKIFQVRETENDVSFLRNYLTEELVDNLDLYLYQKVGHEWRVVETDWEKVRDGLVTNLINGGHPCLEVEDGDYKRNSELLIVHCYEDKELDVVYLEKTLPYVYLLWGKPVHLTTVIDGKNVRFSYDGKKNTRQII